MQQLKMVVISTKTDIIEDEKTNDKDYIEKAETCPASAAKLSRGEIKNDVLLRFCEGKGTIEEI